MQHGDRPKTITAGDRIAELRHQVQVLMDGDRVLPADGSALIAALDQALEGLANGDGLGARAGITAFVGQVQLLIAAGLHEIGDDHPLIEAAAALVAGLPKAGGTDQGTRRRRGDTSTG